VGPLENQKKKGTGPPHRSAKMKVDCFGVGKDCGNSTKKVERRDTPTTKQLTRRQEKNLGQSPKPISSTPSLKQTIKLLGKKKNVGSSGKEIWGIKRDAPPEGFLKDTPKGKMVNFKQR